MSTENVDTVRASLEEFNRGGIDALLPFVPSDAVWYSVEEWLEDPVYYGHEGAASSPRPSPTTSTTRQPVGVLQSDFRDGMVGELRFFLTWHQALEAVGLSE
jgi:hypothetical protein